MQEDGNNRRSSTLKLSRKDVEHISDKMKHLVMSNKRAATVVTREPTKIHSHAEESSISSHTSPEDGAPYSSGLTAEEQKTRSDALLKARAAEAQELEEQRLAQALRESSKPDVAVGEVSEDGTHIDIAAKKLLKLKHKKSPSKWEKERETHTKGDGEYKLKKRLRYTLQEKEELETLATDTPLGPPVVAAIPEVVSYKSMDPTTRKRRRRVRRSVSVPAKKVLRTIRLDRDSKISVTYLASQMAVKVQKIVRMLRDMGEEVTEHSTVNCDIASLIVKEFDHRYVVQDAAFCRNLFEIPLLEAREDLPKKPPVVTVMGHVDHGKTSLLDALRHSNVTASEAGSITQHIGAYSIKTPREDRLITLIDTPGHEAFTKMRKRGSQITDIIILVIAADDGLMPQTIESIQHAQEADVPLVLAINKIDLPNANPDKVRNEVLKYNILVEELGGEVPCVPISVKKQIGIDELEQAVLLLSDMLDLRYDPQASCVCTVIESTVDKSTGIAATLMIQSGTVKRGDILVSRTHYFKVRKMLDQYNKELETASTSLPVYVLGFSEIPEIGTQYAVVESEKQAKEVVDYYAHREDSEPAQEEDTPALPEQDIFEQSDQKKIHFIVRADTMGSAQAISDSLKSLKLPPEVSLSVIQCGVNGVTKSDLMLAQTFQAIILLFNLSVDSTISQLAKTLKVKIISRNVIYDLIDAGKAEISSLLAPRRIEDHRATALVKQIYPHAKTKQVVGCVVQDGLLKKSHYIKVLRQGKILHEGFIETLKHYKENVQEVETNSEFGLVLKDFHAWQIEDTLKSYEISHKATILE